MKNLKIISKLVVLSSFISGAFMMSCQDQFLRLSELNSQTGAVGLREKSGYLIFGHVGGFCMNCDVLYKIENDSIYATKFSTNLNPDSAVFSFLKLTSKDSLVGRLPYTIPAALFNEQSVEIGAPRPDVGHYYLAVSTRDIVRHWYIEAYGVPDYLKPYLANVQTAMSKLR